MSLISLRDWNASRKAAFAAGATYAFLLAAPGIYTPFFPLWLSSRGFDAQEMGLLMAIPMLMRVTSAPLTWIGDGPLGPRRTFLFITCGAAFGFTALYFAYDFASIAVMLALAFVFSAATTPLLDTIVLNGVAVHGHKYGRIRQWGSLSWLLAGLVAGLVLKHLPITTVPPLMAMMSALTVFAGLSLPNDRASSNRQARQSANGTAPPVLLLATFVMGVACIQGAHAFLYGFATLIWQRQGFSSIQIGELWAIGVLVETSVFLLGSNIAGWLGPYRLIVIGGTAGMIRWTLLGMAPESGYAIAALQAMHGLTFACVHFATMGWLARFTRNPSARQGIVASAIGLGLTIATVLAGQLYATFAAHGFFAMTLIGACGIGLVLVAASIERRGR
jgi:MFS transporter, PPP family, 3-phenylpropionic acid transporter